MLVLFKNTMPNELARRLGVKPKVIRNITDLDDEFAQICNSGLLKWVINENSELVIIPKWVDGDEVPHSVLVNGNPVQAAGEVEISLAGSESCAFYLTNNSGHYRPSVKSKGICRAFLQNLGIKVY